MDNINTLDELFEKWIEKQNEENPETYLPKEIPAYSFDKDGYVCKDEYENSKTRILFIGKEKYKFWKTDQKVNAKHVSTLIGEYLGCNRGLTEDEAIKFNIKWNEIDKGFWLKNVTENENLHNQVIIPEGATYTTANGTVINSGSNFPTAQVNDVYEYGNYSYRLTSVQTGWVATAIKGSNLVFNSPASHIQDMPVWSMVNAFADFDEPFTLSTSFRIPSTVKNINSLFKNADGLTALPQGFTIPDNVQFSSNVFAGCVNLTTLPSGFSLSANSKNLTSMFEGCTNLTATINLNNVNPQYCTSCFAGTTKTITLTGTSPMAETLVATSSANNIKFA